MKKKLLVLVAFSTLATSGWAQTSVDSTGCYSVSGGCFMVYGSGATSIETANISFCDDTLRIILDGGGSTLRVPDKSINTAYNGQIDIRGVFEIDTYGSSNGTIGDVFNISWASDTILTNAATIFTVLGGYEFELGILENADRNGNAGSNRMSQLTVIPEPRTLGMVGLLGSALVWIRRKS